MTDLEGGRHGVDGPPLELGDWVGLPEPVAPRETPVERRVIGTRLWASELYSKIEIDIYEAPAPHASEDIKS